jgi:hypothetical protein
MNLQVYLRERFRLESAGLCEGGRFRRPEQNRGGHWDEQVSVLNHVAHHTQHMEPIGVQTSREANSSGTV